MGQFFPGPVNFFFSKKNFALVGHIFLGHRESHQYIYFSHYRSYRHEGYWPVFKTFSSFSTHHNSPSQCFSCWPPSLRSLLRWRDWTCCGWCVLCCQHWASLLLEPLRTRTSWKCWQGNVLRAKGGEKRFTRFIFVLCGCIWLNWSNWLTDFLFLSH